MYNNVLSLTHKRDKNILEYLYREYYLNHTTYSSVTSSHWIKYGRFQNVSKNKKGFHLSGQGFGDFQNDNIVSRLKNIPISIYVSKMLTNCDQDIIIAARKLVKETKRIFSYDVARMALTINFLKLHINNKLDNNTYAIIGDGYGTFGSLIKAVEPNAKIIFINLGKTLFFDAYYTHKMFPHCEHKLLCLDMEHTYSNDFNYIEAEYVFKMPLSANIFINIASMQEMNPDIIQQYFSVIRNQINDTYFYCCNRIQKELPDGTITRFFAYGWLETDEIIIDELCPWHQEAPKSIPPFKFKFDGPIQHRLIKIKPTPHS